VKVAAFRVVIQQLQLVVGCDYGKKRISIITSCYQEMTGEDVTD
jgi:hypothetical protein